MEPRDLFEILVRDHIDSVRAFLLASLRDSVAAEDVLQETFLVAWRILDRYDRQLTVQRFGEDSAAHVVRHELVFDLAFRGGGHRIEKLRRGSVAFARDIASGALPM